MLAVSIAVLFLASSISAAISVQSNYDQIEMLCMVNSERAAASPSLPPLGLHPALAATAQDHSNDQANRHTMTHDDSQGRSLGQRVEAGGLSSWKSVGENVAMGYSDEVTCMKAWMKSPGHRENILNPKFVWFGSAVSWDGNVPYYTQDFAGDGAEHTFPLCPKGESGAYPTSYPAVQQAPASYNPAPAPTSYNPAPAPIKRVVVHRKVVVHHQQQPLMAQSLYADASAPASPPSYDNSNNASNNDNSNDEDDASNNDNSDDSSPDDNSDNGSYADGAAPSYAPVPAPSSYPNSAAATTIGKKPCPEELAKQQKQ